MARWLGDKKKEKKKWLGLQDRRQKRALVFQYKIQTETWFQGQRTHICFDGFLNELSCNLSLWNRVYDYFYSFICMRISCRSNKMNISFAWRFQCQKHGNMEWINNHIPQIYPARNYLSVPDIHSSDWIRRMTVLINTIPIQITWTN